MDAERFEECGEDERRARIERGRYRECESFGCGERAEWQAEDGSWWCGGHTQ